jgi:hypothetical protein
MPPTGQAAPTLNLNISPSGQMYAWHSKVNAFGENASVNGGYTYHYSPRITLASQILSNGTDKPEHQGSANGFQLPLTPRGPFPTGTPYLPAQGKISMISLREAIS